jgi:hypothetical protein
MTCKVACQVVEADLGKQPNLEEVFLRSTGRVERLLAGVMHDQSWHTLLLIFYNRLRL